MSVPMVPGPLRAAPHGRIALAGRGRNL